MRTSETVEYGRAIADLAQLSDADLFSTAARGLRLILANGLNLWRGALFAEVVAMLWRPFAIDDATSWGELNEKNLETLKTLEASQGLRPVSNDVINYQ